MPAMPRIPNPNHLKTMIDQTPISDEHAWSDPFGQQHVRLIVSQKLERRANALLEALRVLDRQMSGNETYEHAWVNHPTNPDDSPASLVRKAISENDNNPGTGSK